jgi:hypothetical protein
MCPSLLDELSLLRGQQSDSLHHHHHSSWCLGDEGDDLMRREGDLMEGDLREGDLMEGDLREDDLLALPSGPSLPSTMLPPLSAAFCNDASHSVEAVGATATTSPLASSNPNPSQHTNGGMSDEQKEQLQKILDSIALDLSSRDKYHPDKSDDRDLSTRDKHHHPDKSDDRDLSSRDKHHHPDKSDDRDLSRRDKHHQPDKSDDRDLSRRDKYHPDKSDGRDLSS